MTGGVTVAVLGLRSSVWQRYQGVVIMKLEVTRALFLVGALGVASMAVAAWHEPSPSVVSVNGLGYCPLPPNARSQAPAQPDQSLLLLMFGLSQGLHPQG